MVVHACIPSYLGGVSRRIAVLGQPLAKKKKKKNNMTLYLKNN
jgi:hypothetical protein